MPKVGMEPIRRGALVQATIHEIGRAGSLDVTVTQIAKRAGMSSALAHHYFGAKSRFSWPRCVTFYRCTAPKCERR